MSRVADVLVDTLVAAGVRNVYGVAGDSLNAITDSIRPRSDIRWIHVRHEEAAGFAAGAEAQLTGRLAVCAGSCGPGNLHLINGLFDAHRSRAPVLAIASQIPLPELGTDYFQETHPEVLFRDCSHYRELISAPEQLSRVLDIAIETALAHRGVAVVVLPGDVAMRAAVDAAPRPSRPRATPRIRPTDDDLSQLTARLNAAERVTILAGSGCAGAREPLLRLAGALHAPIVHTLRGKESLEHENPFDVGMTGLIGFSSGYHAMMNADLLLMLGTDFPYRQFYPDGAKKVQVDIAAERIGRRTRVDLGVVGDVASTVEAVLPSLRPRTDTAHLLAAQEHYQKARQQLDDLAVGEPGKRPIHPQYVAKVLDELAAPDAVVTCDVGLPTVWAARYLRMNGTRRLLGSFWHGSMANALPQAIGAQSLFPDRQVISLSGDGGIAMLLGELLTLRQMALPVKVIVFNNRSLGFVQLEQKSAGLLESGVDLVNPDFAGIARSAELVGLRAELPEEVRPKLAELLAHPGPGLLDVSVAQQEVVMPPTLRREVVEGVGLWLIKAVLSGRGDEVVDLARTNLFR